MLKSGRTKNGSPYLYYEVNAKFKDDKMTNELGTTLQDIEAKAERKRDAISCLDKLFIKGKTLSNFDAKYLYDFILKYIEEN